MELERATPPLTSAHIDALRSAGVTSVEALMVLQPHNVMQVTGVTMLEALVILRAACVILCPVPSTVSELLAREQERRPFIPTPLPALTTALRGGLAPTVTEVVGPAGAGKTQFCLSLMVIAATVEEGVTPAGDCGPPSVILIETEGAFNPVRLRQVAQESRPDLYGGGTTPEAADRNLRSLLGRIRVYREETARGLLSRIRSLDVEVLAGERARPVPLSFPPPPLFAYCAQTTCVSSSSTPSPRPPGPQMRQRGAGGAPTTGGLRRVSGRRSSHSRQQRSSSSRTHSTSPCSSRTRWGAPPPPRPPSVALLRAA